MYTCLITQQAIATL